MVVSPLVVAHSPLLDALLGHGQVNVDEPVLPALCGKDAQLHRIQGSPRIPVCRLCQKFLSLLFQNCPVHSHPLFRIRHSPPHQLYDISLFKRFQLKDPGSGNQSSVHLKIRIFRGCADENKGSVLHKGQKIVLLALVETVNLIHKKDRLLPVHSKSVFGLLYRLLHVLFSGCGGINLGEAGAGGIGNHSRKRCLSSSRRPVKNH